MLQCIRNINNNYAGVLSLFASLIMVGITIVYVFHTRRQANYAKESVDLLTKELKTSKQPCIVPTIIGSKGSAFEASTYTRIQLGFNVDLKNVGDAPAINVYTLADIELQISLDAAGNKKRLTAALLPVFVQALSVGDHKSVSIHFETKEVNALVEELRIKHEMNLERLRTNPTRHHYVGALLNIRVLFKNMMGQWGESIITYEIPWLQYKNPPPITTGNVNEYTIPPREIQQGDEFRAIWRSNNLSPFSYRMVKNEYVKNELNPLIEESPLLAESIKMEFQDLAIKTKDKDQ